MTLEQTLQLIQVAYPQVYLACHTRHQRKRSTPHRLSARDATIVAHLSDTKRTGMGALVTRLGHDTTINRFPKDLASCHGSP